MNKIKVFAPASVSNVGPGFDVMGFAVNNLGDEITAIKKNKSYGVKITEIECPGFKIPKAVSKNTAGTAAKSLLKTLDFPFGVELRIKKNYGIGTGLGSSASSAAAAVFAVNKLAGEPLTKIELVNFAMEGEKVASGNYHADNIAPSLLGGFTIIRNYTPLDIIKLKPNMKIYCGLFMPKIKVETKAARSILRKTVPLKKTVEQTGNIAGLVAALFSGNKRLLKDSLVDVIIEPQRAKLIPHFEELKELILEDGALGCSISGSGPTLFFFSDDKKKAKNILEAARKYYSERGFHSEYFISGINYSGAKVVK